MIPIPWFKVDDGFADHQKTVAAGNKAIGLWVRAGAWCSKQLTDGVVPKHMVPVLGGTPADARKLVDVRLWETHPDGYRFHQWNDEGRQPRRLDVEEKRAEWRERQRRSRAKKTEPEDGVA